MDLINLNNLEQAKQESIQTLNYNSFFKIREEIPMNEVRVGNIIKHYTKYNAYIGKVSRITAKTIFIKHIKSNDNNFIKDDNFYITTSDGKKYLERSTCYYFTDINNTETEEREIKIRIKDEKIDRATRNFTTEKETDWGR